MNDGRDAEDARLLDSGEHARPPPTSSRLGEQPAQLIAADPSDTENAGQRASLEFAVVHRHRKGPALLCVDEDVVTPADPVELPASLLEDADQLFGFDRRKSLTHVGWTATCSRWPSWTGQPRSLITSR